MRKIISIAPLIMTLMGCATGYHPDRFNGGYTQFKLSADVYRVSFSGNAYTSSEQANQFALRRAAEIATEKGSRYFKVLTSSSMMNRNASKTPLMANTYYGSSNSITTYSGGDTLITEKPSAVITIKLLKLPSKDTFDANIILSNFSSQNLNKKRYPVIIAG